MDLNKLKGTFDTVKKNAEKQKEKLNFVIQECMEAIQQKKEEKQPQIDQLKKKAIEKTKHIADKIQNFKNNHKID